MASGSSGRLSNPQPCRQHLPE